jgi:acyl-CoA synthetase (AMP-forming)/AMP-acid ligase II
MIEEAAKPPGGNPFLDPVLARWRNTPEALFGVFHDGDDWHRLDIAAFMKRALQFSAVLVDAGVVAEDIVLLILQHGIDAHAAFIGAMIIGAVPSLMPYPNVKQDTALYWSQHRQVFKHLSPRAILVYEAIHQAVSEAALGSGAAILDLTMADAKAPAQPGHVPPGSAIALLQHSSGTTGLKKGVALSYQAINDQLEAYCQALQLQDVREPRIATWLPLYHDMGLITSFLLPVWLGVPILSIDPFEWTRQPSLLFDAVQDYRATHVWLPNFALLHHVRSARGSRTWDLSSLAAIVCCSEPCKPEAFDAFLRRFTAWGLKESVLQTSYAMAETVFAVTQSRTGKPVRRLCVDRAALQTRARAVMPSEDADQVVLLSNGPPVAGCEVRILSDGKFADERVVGEVCIAAPWLFSGYYNNPDATQQAFHGSWLRSGDLGFLDQGEIFVVGRLKDVIIVNGKNIFAHDVEAAVSRVPNVKPGRAVAFGYYVESLGSEQLVVVAERLDQADNDTTAASLLNHAVAEEVGVGCGDVRMVEPGWLVKTTSGKISRSENIKKYMREFFRGDA